MFEGKDDDDDEVTASNGGAGDRKSAFRAAVVDVEADSGDTTFASPLIDSVVVVDDPQLLTPLTVDEIVCGSRDCCRATANRDLPPCDAPCPGDVAAPPVRLVL